MTFNRNIHHRRSIRLKNYDYSQKGAYFITVCTWGRLCIFGNVVNNMMKLNEHGNIVQTCWNDIPNHADNIGLDAFIIMPNHFHGIITFLDAPSRRGKACLAPTTNGTISAPSRFGNPSAHSLSSIIGSLKSAATRLINKNRNTPGMPVWQRNYHEHIIRTDDDMNKIREYIQYNPSQWADDDENPEKHA